MLLLGVFGWCCQCSSGKVANIVRIGCPGLQSVSPLRLRHHLPWFQRGHNIGMGIKDCFEFRDDPSLVKDGGMNDLVSNVVWFGG